MPSCEQKGAKLISMRQDATSLARVAPVDLAMVADVKLGTADLIAAIKSMATASRLKEIADERGGRVRDYTKHAEELRQTIAQEHVQRIDHPHGAARGRARGRARQGHDLRHRLRFRQVDGPADVVRRRRQDLCQHRAQHPGLGRGGGVRRQAGAAGSAGGRILGDGSMLFGGPQPLWSMARYSAPVTVIVFNNKSYNNERNRIWTFGGGAQFKEGRDMTCYNGSPDVDFAKAASAFGVEGETVKEPGKIKDALARAKRANVEGRPYLLDIDVERDGVGAASAWHPPYSIAEQRTRKV